MYSQCCISAPLHKQTHNETLSTVRRISYHSLSLSFLPPSPSSNCRRYPKEPFERGKSLQEVAVHQPSSLTPSGYERGMSPEELTSTLHKEVGTRYLHHRGSIRANFTSPGGSAFLTRWAQWLNKVGKEKRDYSLLCFHKKGRTRRFCKKIVKSK